MLKAKLPNTDLSWVSFRGANLTLADFYKSDLWQADLWGATLWGATFWNADLRTAKLRGSNLDGANFEGAKLSIDLAEGTILCDTILPDGHIIRSGC